MSDSPPESSPKKADPKKNASDTIGGKNICARWRVLSKLTIANRQEDSATQRDSIARKKVVLAGICGELSGWPSIAFLPLWKEYFDSEREDDGKEFAASQTNFATQLNEMREQRSSR